MDQPAEDMTLEEAGAEHERLAAEIRRHDELYYSKNAPAVSDADYDALRRRLERGEVSAILDVFDPEPLPAGSPLWKTPNLIITPHCSSDDTLSYTPKTLDMLFTQMERFIAGRKLANIVSRTLEY